MKCDNIFCYSYNSDDSDNINCDQVYPNEIKECKARLKYEDYIFSQANSEMIEGVKETSEKLKEYPCDKNTELLLHFDGKNKFEEGNILKFNKVLKERLVKIEKVLSNKAEEYAKGTNRYHNFEIASRILGNSREKALLGMMVKHWVSVLDLIHQSSNDPLKLKKEIIDEKIGDSINYLILLEGMLMEQIE